MTKLGRREIIIFNGIPGAKGFKFCKTRNITKSFVLNIFRKRSAESVYIDFDRIPALRLNKQLVPLLFSKPVKFVFNAGAITRSYSIDSSGEHRTAIEPCFENIMNSRIRIGNPATSLFFG